MSGNKLLFKIRVGKMSHGSLRERTAVLVFSTLLFYFRSCGEKLKLHAARIYVLSTPLQYGGDFLPTRASEVQGLLVKSSNTFAGEESKSRELPKSRDWGCQAGRSNNLIQQNEAGSGRMQKMVDVTG